MPRASTSTAKSRATWSPARASRSVNRRSCAATSARRASASQRERTSMAESPWNRMLGRKDPPARAADTEKSMSKNFAENKPATPPPAPAKEVASGTCILGPTLHFKGELYGEEDLEFQGQLEGSIEHTRSLSIGKEGGVTGNIKAKFVIVEGRVDGDIYASESVSVRASAKVKGNIYAPRVGIADGANFSGSIDMNHKGAAAGTRPATVQVTLSDPAAERLLTKAAG